jgi:CRISPR-associated protein Cas1
MSLWTIHLTGSRLTIRQGTLTLQVQGTVVAQKPVHEVSEVHLYGEVDLTADARNLLAAHGVDVLFFTGAGTYRGRFISAESSQGDRRLAQYRYMTDPVLAQRLAAAMIHGKVLNQRQFLARMARDAADPTFASRVAALKLIAQRIHTASDMNALQGFEGLAARHYFEGISLGLRNPDFDFRGRNRRPPRDPVNACLSFGYTLLLRKMESAVRATGLDPYIGVLHETGRGAPCLALDLMEEFRPIIVDRLVMRLFNRRQLSTADFGSPDVNVARASEPFTPERDADQESSGAVYMLESGRKTFLAEWAATWRQLYPCEARANARFELNEIIRIQALQVAALVEARQEVYLPFRIPG